MNANNLNLNRIKTGFDFLSRFYDFLVFASSGNLLLNAKTFYIKDLLLCKSILILGGGTGQFLVALLESGFSGKVTFLDISENMIERSKKKIKNRNHKARVFFVLGELESLTTQKHNNTYYDCIVSNFFLDMFCNESLTQIFKKISRVTTNTSIFYFTDFACHSKKYDWRCLILKPLYVFFRIICNIEAKTIPDYDSHFQKFNWQLIKKTDRMFQFISSRIYKRVH